MPITLTIPDDIALNLLQQITEGLTKRPAEPVAETVDGMYRRGISETQSHFDKLVPGDVIRVVAFAHRIGVPTASVSDALQKLKKSGEIVMVQKGTWRKLVPPVARAV